MSIPARVSIVTLGARDLPALRAFYERFGWDELPLSGEEWTCFDTGGALLALFPLDELVRDALLTPPGRDRGLRDGAFCGITLSINVESGTLVDTAMEQAAEAGATILKDPVVAPWGVYSGYFADPEGNVWEVGYVPGSDFADGEVLVLPEA